MAPGAGATGEAASVIALSLLLARDHAPLQALIKLAFAAGAVVLAARASGGHFAEIVARTMGTSGQLSMRPAICLLMLLVVLSERLQIELVFEHLSQSGDELPSPSHDNIRDANGMNGRRRLSPLMMRLR